MTVDTAAKCGMTHGHGAHSYARSLEATDGWCAGNRDVVTAVEHRLRGLYATEDRLRVQGATTATLDAHAAAVRRLTVAGVARTLRDVAGSPDYSLGDIDPAIVARIAAQIERMA